MKKKARQNNKDRIAIKTEFLIPFLSATILLWFFVSSCGLATLETPVKSSIPEQATEEVYTDASTHILPKHIFRLYTGYSDADQNLIDRTIEAIEKNNSEIQIIVEPRTDMNGNIIKTRAAVGELPDYIEGSPVLMNALQRTGDILPLEESIVTMNRSNLFAENALSMRKSYDGHIYGISLNREIPMNFYYNKSIFTRLRLTAPDNYEEFAHTVTVLKKNGYIPLTIYAQEKWLPVQLLDMAVVAENSDGLLGSPFSQTNTDSEAVRKAAEKLEYLISIGLLDKDALTTDTTRAYKIFRNGQAGMLFDSRWYLTNTAEYIDEIGVFLRNPFADTGSPQGSLKHASGGVNSTCYMLSSNATQDEMKSSTFFLFLAEKAKQEVLLYNLPNLLQENIVTELQEDNMLLQMMRQNLHLRTQTRFAWNPAKPEMRNIYEDFMHDMITQSMPKDNMSNRLVVMEENK